MNEQQRPDSSALPAPTGGIDVAQERKKDRTSENFRAVLDFVSKMFYPIIVVCLIVVLFPKIEKIDFDKLLGRMEKAKIGENEFSFSKPLDEANTNNKFTKFERLVQTLQSDVAAIQKNVSAAKVPESTKQEREASDQKFKENSKYTVLVFNRPNRSPAAEQITNALLQIGYKSSRTETDLTEAKISYPAGTIRIIHGQEGEKIVPNVKQIIQDLNLNQTIKVETEAYRIQRGDVQVELF
jgi:hypothetical protein